MLRWYMPFNILLTFLIGGVLGWIVVKITKPPSHLRAVVVGNCAAGNLGTLLLIIIPAICQEKGSPFGDPDVCVTHGMAYVSFSMAVGAIYIWSFVYNIVRISSESHEETEVETRAQERIPTKDCADAGILSTLLQTVQTEMPTSAGTNGSTENRECSSTVVSSEGFSKKVGKGNVVGFVIGMIPQAKQLLVAPNGSLRLIQDSVTLLGDGAIPSAILLLGGNLTKGLHSSEIRSPIIVGIAFVRFLILPAIGVLIVEGASYLGMVKSDPLYHFILLIQFALPPAMSMGTMTQLFGVGESECSVIFLWTYLLSSIALTAWSTVYMWIST